MFTFSLSVRQHHRDLLGDHDPVQHESGHVQRNEWSCDEWNRRRLKEHSPPKNIQEHDVVPFL